MNRAARRRLPAGAGGDGVLVGACWGMGRYVEIEVEAAQVRRLMRAEGLSFEEAFMELLAAACPICHPKREAN